MKIMNRRVLLSLLALFVLSFPVFAQYKTEENLIQVQNIDVSNLKIKKEIKESIDTIYEPLYGKVGAQEIYDKVLDIAQKSIEERSNVLKEQDRNRKDDWYKNEIIYMFYVDQFGVVQDDKKNTFKDTARMFDYLEDLGVTTLYMLPFADSPMKDAGFDVKNPQSVRRDLGGMVEFREFITQAKKRGFKIKADLVLNHLSDNHEWFKKIRKW